MSNYLVPLAGDSATADALDLALFCLRRIRNDAARLDISTDRIERAEREFSIMRAAILTNLHCLKLREARKANGGAP